MSQPEVTPEHIGRATAMGTLDVEQVAAWLARDDAKTADIALLRAALDDVRMVDRIRAAEPAAYHDGGM